MSCASFPPELGNDEDQGIFAVTILESTHQAVVIVDKTERRIIWVNPAFVSTTGYTLDEVKGKTLFDVKSGRHNKAFYRQIWTSLEERGCWSGEIWGRRRNGDTFPSLHTISPIFDSRLGCVTHYVSMFSDISALKRQQANLGHLAYHDPLTGLPNRLMLLDRLEHALRSHVRNRMQLAVLFVDLDGFKAVNDRLGHAIGDRLLQVTAERFEAALRSGDTLARLGGDEFVIVIESCKSRAGIVRIAEKLIASIASPLRIEGHDIEVRASIGIAVAPQDGKDPDEILNAADQAMYRVKTRKGGGAFCFFDERWGK
ncbi:MAG: sensor domain-containing diguanylate cyclase [Thiogranum sp.]|nr:sensor domain-containing diguanylate cyclase [Thiogranum sp.]